MEDAVNSVAFVLETKEKYHLHKSAVVSALYKLAFDFSKGLPNKIRKAIVGYLAMA